MKNPHAVSLGRRRQKLERERLGEKGYKQKMSKLGLMQNIDKKTVKSSK